MTQINPFLGAVAQSTQVQQRQSAEKQRQIRRLQNLGKNAALQGEEVDHEVESAAVSGRIDGREQAPAHRSSGRQRSGAGQSDKQDEGHIDLTA